MNSEFVEWIADGMDHVVVPPDAHVHDVLAGIWDKVDLDFFSKWHPRHLDGMIEQGNAAIAVHHSGFT